MKILFQDLCIEKVDWNYHLTADLLDRWLSIIKDLETADIFTFKRQYCFKDLNDPFVSIQLHSFSDASKRAHASCSYLRFQQVSGTVKICLLTSKSRVNTITKTKRKKSKRTMPRLELQGALLMAQLTNSVIDNLKNIYSFDKMFTWVDSSIVYCWILNKHKLYKKFVQNRLKKIRTLLPSTTWKLISSDDNPADIGSRGSSVNDLIENSLWFEGPEFLIYPEDQWPNINIYKKENNNNNGTCLISVKEDITLVSDEEELDTRLTSVKNEVACLSAATTQIISFNNVIDISKFSSLKTLLRVTAYVFKFVRNLKARAKRNLTNNTSPGAVTGKNPLWLSPSEIHHAKIKWIQDAQLNISSQKNFKQISDALNLFNDDDGLLRCRGRLDYANISYNTNNPWLLDKNHRLTELIVLDSHHAVGHDGVRETLTNIRYQFWIPKARNYVRRIIKSCTLCKRHEGKAYKYPSEPPLPASRVSLEPAFTYVGLDYAGPIHLKNVYYIKDNDMYKAWVALFTCASSRCIYLDISTDYSGLSCTEVLSRFINRRGAPKEIISDCGSNFTSVEVQNFASSRNIKWKLNIPKAPWTGGFVERMVKSVKRIMRKVLQNAKITYDEMLTVLSQIENIVNNRPLTYLYEEIGEVVTPNHLLFGRNLSTVWGGYDDLNEEKDIDKRHSYLKLVLEHFWNRWQKEYLRELREFNHRYKSTGETISVGDIVLIEDEKLARSKWQLGKVVELVYSRNKQVRAAVVDVVHSDGKKGQLRRPVNKLYPIESGNEANNDIIVEPAKKVQLKFIDERNIQMNDNKVKLTFVDDRNIETNQ